MRIARVCVILGSVLGGWSAANALTVNTVNTVNVVKGCAPGTRLCYVDDGEVSICYDPKTEICCVPKIQEVCSKNMICTDTGCASPPPPPVTGTAVAKYMILGLYYTPPGKGSQVVYASGFDVDSETDISHSFQGGVIVDLGTNVLSLHSEFNFQSTTGTTSQVEVSGINGFQLTSSAKGPDDMVPRGQDWFKVWVGPTTYLSKQSADGKPDVITVTLDLNTGQIVDLLADDINSAIRELNAKGWATLANNPTPGCDANVTIPCATQALLQSFTVGDFTTILSTDLPYGSDNLDPKRYTFTKQTVELEGPLHDGGPIPAYNYEVDTKDIAGSITGSVTEQKVSIEVGGDVEFIVKFKLMAGLQFDWQQSTQKKVLTGTASKSMVTLTTTTVGVNQLYDVYLDSVYNTFAFKLHAPNAAENATLQGQVMDSQGKPKPGVEVDFIPGDGSVRVRTITAPDGTFLFKSLPSGAPDPQVLVVDSQGLPLGGMAPQKVKLKAQHPTAKIIRLP
jgi:hypothetical protein